MTTYVAPLEDMLFVIRELTGLDDIAKLPGWEEVTPDIAEAILNEAGKFAAEVFAPINATGDRVGNRLQDGVVTTAPGFKDAYKQFVANGWQALLSSAKYGGQELPYTLVIAVHEMWKAANLAFSPCTMLTHGAAQTIERHASETLKEMYLRKMVAGEWSGTMNLSEPQAGSDLAAIRTRAVPEGDHYRIRGAKIFITWGEQDFTENIVHLVLARIEGAPPGVRGISLFLVPKYLVNPDGSVGVRNDVLCVGLEHKLGVHASPTAALNYGEKGGAVGYLIGEPQRGLEYMFTMMNYARLSVGLEGVGIAERAYQQALSYARERVQGCPIGMPPEVRATIIEHPDVRRMLMSMKAQVEAMRALAYYGASCMDWATRHPDGNTRRRYQGLLDLLTPVVKGWCTEQSIEIASTGIQVHGGVGFIEETGAAQHLRDARITAIYEGTTGIQAMDLVGRKVAREQGATVKALLAEMREACGTLETSDADLRAIRAGLEQGIAAVERSTEYIIATFEEDARLAAAGSVPYLLLLGTVGGAWQMAQGARVSRQKLYENAGDREFCQAKIVTARFYMDHILPRSLAYSHEIVHGADSTLRLDECAFG